MSASAQSPSLPQAGPTPAIIAINVLIEPGAAITAKAKELNARLKTEFPSGFALDETHVPHISLLHRFVRTEDLEKIRAAIAHVSASHAMHRLALAAKGLEVSPWQGAAMTSISIEKNAELATLQAELVDALRPFTAADGDERAFVRSPSTEHIDAATLQYVRTFVPQKTGGHFEPHVTVGMSTMDFARKLQQERFDAITFQPAGMAVYQLGNAGTARKKLWP